MRPNLKGMKAVDSNHCNKISETRDAEYLATVAAIDEALRDWDNRHNWRTHEEVLADLLRRANLTSDE